MPGPSLIDRLMPAPENLEPRQVYHWYMAGQGLFFFAGGIGFVLTTWLIAFYLEATPEVLSRAQLVMSLPQLFFILIGGMMADRVELRAHLARLHILLLIPLALLILIIVTGRLTVTLIVAVSIIGGVLFSFVQPARDSLLTRVTLSMKDRSIQQTVTIANMMQFGTQIIGILLAGTAAMVGPVPLVLTQFGISVAGIYAVTRLAKSPPSKQVTETKLEDIFIDIWEGLREAVHSDQIRPIMFWLGCTGFITMGIYLVVLPLVIRDIYGGDAVEFSLVNACFFIGVTISSYWLSKFGHFKHQGRMLLFAQFGSASLVVSMGFESSMIFVYGALLGWGLIAAISMSMTRSIVQQAAPDTHRARILSVYQLVMFGGAPVGSILAGFSVDYFGVLETMRYAGSITITVTIIFALFSGLWRLKMPEVQPDTAHLDGFDVG